MSSPIHQQKQAPESSQGEAAPKKSGKFDSARQNAFFKAISEQQFSGRICIEVDEGKPWKFFFHLGRIVYASGGDYSVKRWKRHVGVHLQEMDTKLASLAFGSESSFSGIADLCWEYYSLLLLVENEQLTLEYANEIIHAILTEIFFDFNQLNKTAHKATINYSFDTQLALIKPQEIIYKAWTDWQSWEGEGLTKFSPNSVPTIRDPDQLQEKTSLKIYKVLTKLLDGKRSIRDLEMIMKRSFVQVATSLKPYIKSGVIDLVVVHDLPRPSIFTSSPETPPPASKPQKPPQNGEKPLIACVDDSPMICKKMREIFTGADYRFLEINDGVRALASLLRHKPDFIFLDLVMPVINGYEVCSKLRKIPHFKNTPIVILTGNDGVIDRLRAKMVGSTDFVSKPIQADLILGMVQTYLKQEKT